jgi:hypothetical protein
MWTEECGQKNVDRRMWTEECGQKNVDRRIGTKEWEEENEMKRLEAVWLLPEFLLKLSVRSI